MDERPHNPDQVMETKSPFDLNEAVRQWREASAQSTPIRTDELDELEHHLRDSIGGLRAKQLTDEESFLIARHRLGSKEALDLEFAKANPNRAWQTWLCWMLAGILLMQALMKLPNLFISLWIHYAPAWFSGHWLGVIAVLTGWALLAALCALALRLTTSKSKPLRRWILRCTRYPLWTVIALLLLGGLLSGVTNIYKNQFGAIPQEILSRRLIAYTWTGLGFDLALQILLVSTLVFLARRALKPQATN